MRSASTSKVKSGIALCLLSCATALVRFGSAAQAAQRDVGVYCLRDHRTHAVQIFAGRILPSGRLKFGLSQWDAKGQHIGVMGVAGGRAPHWKYTSGLNAPSSYGRCSIDISLTADRTLRVRADPIEACQSHGGYGAEIGLIAFLPSAYEGPVKHELQDPETFFNGAGRC